MQMDIAIDELFSNIAHYAYPQETGEATVDIDIDGERRVVELTFRDRGIPYNPLAKEAPDVTGSAEEREAGGVGIYIVKQSMDEMFYEYRDGRTYSGYGKNSRHALKSRRPSAGWIYVFKDISFTPVKPKQKIPQPTY